MYDTLGLIQINLIFILWLVVFFILKVFTLHSMPIKYTDWELLHLMDKYWVMIVFMMYENLFCL